MAIVALQLVAASIRLAITSNAREVNQGDLNVGLQAAPLQRADLTYFDGLVAGGTISRYSPESTSSGIVQTAGGRRTISLRAIDTTSYPLVGSNRVAEPSGRTLSQTLAAPGSAVLADRLAAELNLRPGQAFRVALSNGGVVQFLVAGIVPTDSGLWSSNSVAVALDSLQQLTGTPPTIQTIVITTSGTAQTQAAAAAIRQELPLASVRSTDDVLQQAQQAVETVRKFLVIIGLLALLIGGAGIMNTERVLLSRRRMEIAVLKTAGFRRRDLHLLFGLEAAMLGFAGGSAGAVAGVVVAVGLRAFFVRAFPVVLPLVIDGTIVIGGVAVGLATALIFGLLPIIQAAGTRPQAVLRDLPETPDPGTRLQSAALVLALAVLFCALASVILKSLLWAALVVGGGFVLLSLLSLVLGAMLWVLGRLPVPEHFTVRHVLLVSAAMLVGLSITAVPSLRGVGMLASAFALLGFAVVLAPRSWQMSAKLAFRNIGRTRGRTTATLLALFIGVFAVGLILVLGADLKSSLGSAITSQLDYNVVVIIPLAERNEIEQQIASLPGLSGQQTSDFAAANPITIDGAPAAQRAVGAAQAPGFRARRQLRLLAGIQGYDLSTSRLPAIVQITAGRNLDPGDAASPNVLVEDSLRQAPLALKEGDSVTLKQANGDSTETLTIVGFYRIAIGTAGASFNLAPILGSQTAARALAGSNPFSVFYLNVSPAKVSAAVSRLENQAPDAVVFNLDDFLAQFERVLNNILILLTAIASLALAAGVIIVANAVALAMLERRRELGILKAVGYTSARVLSGVLLENAITAGLGGLLGMAPVSLAIAIFNRQAGVTFGVPAGLVIAVVLGVIGLTMLTTTLVAWGAVRVRPLAVLRYE